MSDENTKDDLAPEGAVNPEHPDHEEKQAEEKPAPKRRGRPPKSEQKAPEEPSGPFVTVGRIVHYRTRSGGFRPGIVAGVVEDLGDRAYVQLVVFNSTGGQYLDDVYLTDESSAQVGSAFFPTF